MREFRCLQSDHEHYESRLARSKDLDLKGTISAGHQLIDYFRLFIVATGCPSERRPQKTVSCYGG